MLIGRKTEKQVLLDALHSQASEMVAVIGRRRVGKTFLVREVYAEYLDIEITALQNASAKEQILHFCLTLKQQFEGFEFPEKMPKNWLEAFFLLAKCLDNRPKEGKYVVFLDELPWFSSHKSGFVTALGWFWNSWASFQRRVVLVICGSAASWMIQKIINDRGGLHNRVTKRIFMQPFTLGETEAYLRSRDIQLNRYHIVQLYMAMGGIPHYLREVKNGLTAAQNIEAICLHPTGLLHREFERLYAALFESSERHVAVIRALAKANKGLDRREIMKATGITDGGTVSAVIEELEVSGFISRFYPFENKKKDLTYRLTDEYSMFYLKFMENMAHPEVGAWIKMSETQAYKTWAGYAFENICLKHVSEIKRALGISGVFTTSSSFYRPAKAGEQGIQIDLLIDRNDKAINLCEMKFYAQEWAFTEEDGVALRRKKALFQQLTKTRKLVWVTVLSTFGIRPNPHSLGVVDQSFTMDVLFGD